MATKFVLNGKQVESRSETDTPLLWVLRDELGLTGTKFGCGAAQCGACTVHVDGQQRRSCVTPIKMLQDANIVTIEGASDRVAEAIKAAWMEIDVPQCGYCQSGQIMSAIALINAVPDPTDAQIDEAMNGNVCRCATYVRIREAIKIAAKALKLP